MEKEKLICHVCDKEKKSYEIYLKNDALSLLRHIRQHEEAREGGEICERCNSYHAMTGVLKEPTDQEFEDACRKAKAAWEKLKNKI